MSAPGPQPVQHKRAVAAWALVHLALGLWALWAWIQGPFGGQGVLDGAELLSLARTGTTGTFETKGPLYPALLAGTFRLLGDSPWSVGLLGLGLSLVTLLACARLAREAGGDGRAAAWAAGAYALSGSALAFAVQPLPTVLATALCAWGALALERAGSTRRVPMALLAGALLAAATLARAPLLAVTLALLGWSACRGRARSAAWAVGALATVALLAGLLWGARAWPAGAAFNLRLGNGAARSGICDVRPGPHYDRVRLEAAFAPVEQRGAAPHFERFQRDALARELAADPRGALGTLVRKAYLFAFRTETVSAADFRHGLARFPLAPLLLASFGIVGALGLWGLARTRSGLLLWPLLAVFTVNVLWMTCARYRFPALPFLCAGAGLLAAARPTAREWCGVAALALALNVNLSGRALQFPGDGLVQEARLLLHKDRADPRVTATLAAAFAAGSRDARAHYECALALEADGPMQDLDAAERHYRTALELAPDYPQAAENLMALWMRTGRGEQALAYARGPGSRVPWAGLVTLNRVALERERAPQADLRSLEADGLRDMALRALAGGDLPGARQWARRAREAGSPDPRLDLPAGP